MKKFNLVVKRHSSKNWDEVLYNRKGWLSLKSGRVNSGDCTRQAITSKNLSEQTILKDDHLQVSSYKEKEKTERFLATFIATMKYAKMKNQFCFFSPIFKNILVNKNDTGDLLKTYAEEERIMFQPRKMLMSRFTIQNGTLNSLLLFIYLELSLCCPKKHRLVEYTPKKRFNSVVQLAVDARRHG